MKFELRTEICPSCGGHMMQIANYGIFPYYFKDDQPAQMKKQNVKYISKSEIDGDKICVECESSGKSSFICVLCEERKNCNQIQESFGDPADHLCKDCYASVSAEKWEAKTEELQECHKYDYM